MWSYQRIKIVILLLLKKLNFDNNGHEFFRGFQLSKIPYFI